MVLSGLTSLVPARWNSSDPKSLELLRGSPVNCILLEHPNWTPALLRAARQQHIETFGVIHPAAQSVEQAREAARLKLIENYVRYFGGATGSGEPTERR